MRACPPLRPLSSAFVPSPTDPTSLCESDHRNRRVVESRTGRQQTWRSPRRRGGVRAERSTDSEHPIGWRFASSCRSNELVATQKNRCAGRTVQGLRIGLRDLLSYRGSQSSLEKLRSVESTNREIRDPPDRTGRRFLTIVSGEHQKNWGLGGPVRLQARPRSRRRLPG
jgi:hypothetical protein